MQNMNQATMPESTTNINLSAEYPLDNHHPSLFSTNPEEIFLREHHPLTSTPQNKDHNLIPVERTQRKNTNTKQELQLLERNGYSIHLVDSFKQRIKTSTFIKHMYASRGYRTESTSIFSQNPYQFTFEACSKQQLLGTLTLTIDSNNGLLADQLYKPEIDAIRSRGKSVCEVSKLAFNSNSNSNSKEIFASLFHIAYIYAYIIHNVNDAFIEINPRHCLFYKRMLGFREIGEQRICQRVNAPAVLLHLELDYMRNQITTLAGKPKCNSRSIYPHFLSQYEQERITEKIQNLIIKQHSYSTCNRPKLVFSY